MAGTEIPQKPENKQDNLEQEWKKFEPYYNTFMTIDSQEDKEFLEGIGNIILKAEQSKSFLPPSYLFLKDLTPEKVGLFIAEMFIDRILPPEYLLDEKKISKFELNKERRKPRVFETTKNDGN